MVWCRFLFPSETERGGVLLCRYPIYRIPVGPTLQNVDACFLTFHSLAKPVTSGEGTLDAGSKLSLPTFGLVSYKFKVSDWDGNGVQEGQKINSLLRAADNWLRLLQTASALWRYTDLELFSLPCLAKVFARIAMATL
ncbi:UNVERIFIED_CONTAM: hypothetical protein Sangu_1961200 [Sesamum angustifolium]|uniref:Uncharacterized protein n=1 Tax=Sesamum angustifolium TaxID=2727405 RepID=A0AAW2LW04_9LAMI